jgi:hypothetical protein
LPVWRSLRQRILEQAAYRCEYCRIAEWPLTIDHIVPVVAWRAATPPVFAPEDPDSLAAACWYCNRAKWGATVGYDGETDADQALFHPRRDDWDEHFTWSPDSKEIVGLTPVGRATIARLVMNRQVYRRQRRYLRAAMWAGEAAWP